MKQRYVYVLAALLTVIGLSVFYYKWQVLGFPLVEDQETSVWTIESAVSFNSGPGSIKVQLLVPTLTPGFRMLNENSVSRGYGFNLNYGSGGREAQWAIRRAWMTCQRREKLPSWFGAATTGPKKRFPRTYRRSFPPCPRVLPAID